MTKQQDELKKQAELWQEVKSFGGGYRPRKKGKRKGRNRRNQDYASPFARAKEGYIDSELRRRGVKVHYRQKVQELVGKTKKAYIEKARAEHKVYVELRAKVWDAFKSNNIVHLGNDIFWQDDIHWRDSVSDSTRAGEDFYDPHQRYRRLIDNDLPTLENPAELVQALGITIQELRWFTYHRDAAKTLHYRPFTIPKKSGGERQIWAPRPKLKAIQHWVLYNIAERLPVHAAAHGFVRGRGIGTNADEHTDSRVIISMDLADFFPSFTFRRVKGIFRSAGYLEGIATLLALLCTEAPRQQKKIGDQTYYIATGSRCLPQGSPASPALTNSACMRLDRRLTGLAEKFGWRYTRYADDLTFSFPVSDDRKPLTEQLIKWITEIANSEGFSVRTDKTKVMGGGNRQEVTGLVVNGQTDPRTPREIRKMLRAAIHNLKQGKPFQEGESLQTLIGYAAYVHSTHPEDGRRLLNELNDLPQGFGTETLQEKK